MPASQDRDVALFSHGSELERELGFTESLSIVFGRIIGSGIFRTPGPIMILVGSVSLFYSVWIFGGIVTLLGAFCYAELVAMMPRSGGPYVYLKTAYPPVWTFLRGWAMFFVSETGAIAAVALVFAEYSNSLYTIFADQSFSRCIELVIAIFAIWSLTLINCFGVLLSGIVQNIFSLIKILALGGIITFCFSKTGNWSHFSTPFLPEEFNWSTVVAFGAALRYGFFAYSGWEGATYVAEEVRKPERNLSRSIILGIIGVMLLYLATNSAYLYQLPVSSIQNSKWIATEAMRAAIGITGGIFISVAVMLNTFGNVSTQILCKARTWYAMSRDGLFFKSLAQIHPKYKTPNHALIVQGIWASVLLFGAAFAERTYEAIIDYFSFTSSVFNVLTFVAVWVLRRKFPYAPRPFKVWGYPFTLIVVILIQVAFMVVTLISAFVPSMLGIMFTSTGLVYYYRKSIYETIKIGGYREKK